RRPRRVHHVRLPARDDAARRAPVPAQAARHLRRGAGELHGLAQPAAGVRLRVPPPARRGMTTAPDRVPAREVLRLAAPAPPVLAAEPLYLLVDTAVVGRLGAVALAGRAVAAVVFAQVTSQLNFLSSGTTSRAARLHGAGRHGDAVGEGVQATWLALAVGLLVLGVGQLVARPVAEALGDGGAIADAATSWLRVALWGAPMVLVTLAGNGWMRGVQDTVRPLRYVLAGNGLSAVLCPVLVHGLGGWGGLGLVGSALANVVGQSLGA